MQKVEVKGRRSLGSKVRVKTNGQTDTIWTRYSLSYCPLSNAFEAATRAYRHSETGQNIGKRDS